MIGSNGRLDTTHVTRIAGNVRQPSRLEQKYASHIPIRTAPKSM